MKYVLAFSIMALGIAAVILGGADDSPGLQGIGVVLFGGGVALVVRARRGRTAAG